MQVWNVDASANSNILEDAEYLYSYCSNVR
jgi:hypothetical protein